MADLLRARDGAVVGLDGMPAQPMCPSTRLAWRTSGPPLTCGAACRNQTDDLFITT